MGDEEVGFILTQAATAKALTNWKQWHHCWVSH